MKIPVFLSGPTHLSNPQNEARKHILSHLKSYGLKPRALGRSDYPTDFPLREVLVIAKHCSGGVILGFEQMSVTTGISKRGTPNETSVTGPVPIPTPWNQLEAGILFGLGLPLLIFREPGITGGVFDPGVTDVFVHDMPAHTDKSSRDGELREVFLKWQARVRDHYYMK